MLASLAEIPSVAPVTFVAVLAGATAGAVILGILLVRYSWRKEREEQEKLTH